MDRFIDDLPVTIEIFHSYVSLPEVIHQMNKFFSAKHESTKWVVLTILGWAVFKVLVD